MLKERPSQPTLLACIATSDSASMACSLQVIYVVGVLKKRLSIPRHSPQLLMGLITACWQDDPDLRPTFMAVCPMLQVSAPQWLRRMLMCERHCIADLGLLVTSCLHSWCGGYSQSYCSAAASSRATDALV